jgi:hypothetical protein
MCRLRALQARNVRKRETCPARSPGRARVVEAQWVNGEARGRRDDGSRREHISRAHKDRRSVQSDCGEAKVWRAADRAGLPSRWR